MSGILVVKGAGEPFNCQNNKDGKTADCIKQNKAGYLVNVHISSKKKKDKKKEKEKKLNKPQFFIVHSTEGDVKMEKIKEWQAKGVTYQAHVYVFADGTAFQLISFDKIATATRKEWTKYMPETKGQMLHVETNYKPGDCPTKAQYEKLASIYKEVKAKYGELIIVPHMEIDRGIRGAHSDPTRFDWDLFYGLLNIDKNGLAKNGTQHWCPTRGRTKSGEPRNNQSDDAQNWPPVLTGPIKIQLKKSKKGK